MGERWRRGWFRWHQRRGAWLRRRALRHDLLSQVYAPVVSKDELVDFDPLPIVHPQAPFMLVGEDEPDSPEADHAFWEAPAEDYGWPQDPHADPFAS